MQELRHFFDKDSLSPETFSVMQLCTINEHLLPSLKTLTSTEIQGWFIPFIPLFLSPRTNSVLLSFEFNIPEVTIASAITTLPRLCPNLQDVVLFNSPRSLEITAAISGMLLVTNRNTLQKLDINSPLTKEASEVLYELPNLCHLSVAIERETPLPSASLPNLTMLEITCDDEDGWPQLFHGATFGKLEYVDFYLTSEQIGDFLGAFKEAALSSSIHNTLSEFFITAEHPWNPNYYSLLPFTQLVDLRIGMPCDGGCPSRVDDDIVVSLSRVMPKLETLALGSAPCGQSTTGVTTKGLLALARHCPKLSTLCVHLQVASLSEPPEIPGMVRNSGPTALRTDCALTELEVGETPVPEGSAMIIALTLLRIFPRLGCIVFFDEGWEEVAIAINFSREIIDFSGKQCPLTTPRGALNDRFAGAALETSG